MKKYDVIVIGSGGGAKITSPAARRGLKIACVEKDKLGGTCLNRGCIPSKMLIHPADVAIEVKEASRFGIHTNSEFQVDFADLVSRISSTVDMDSSRIVAGYSKNPNIDFYHTHARFVSNKVVRVGDKYQDENEKEITADKIFIAVGARPHIPSIEGLEGTPYMTSTEALRNTKLPKTLVVIGASYIATELGHAYGAFGTEVHFLVRSQLLRQEDSEISAEFTRVFSQYHHVHLGAVPKKVEHANGIFTISYEIGGATEQIQTDALLIAAGIVPNTDTLDLKNTDMVVKQGGFLKVDEYLETPVKGVYGMGDCIGNYFFRHSVNFEGEYLFKSVFVDKKRAPISYPPIPHAIFTHPQVAGVGKTEDQLKQENVDYVAGVNPYGSSAMGMAILSDYGFCKILIDRSTKRILGCHIVGPEASNMIHTVIALMNMNATLDDMLKMVYIHPALPEIVRNAGRKAKTALAQSVAAKV